MSFVPKLAAKGVNNTPNHVYKYYYREPHKKLDLKIQFFEVIFLLFFKELSTVFWEY